MDSGRITRIHVTGYRSLRSVDLEPGRVTVLIGANGSGKSNLLSALRMVSLMRTQSLQDFVREAGGASALLHGQAKTTAAIEIRIDFQDAHGEAAYCASLKHAADDTLYFRNESVEHRRDPSQAFAGPVLGSSHLESKLAEAASAARATTVTATAVVNSWLSRMNFYHFHDTSPRSALRQSSRQADDKYVRSDGSNLAAVLYRLCNGDAEEDKAAWKRIEALTRRIAPFVKSLEPGLVTSADSPQAYVRLYWTDDRDDRFDVSAFSDGTLRAIALITALSQPASRLPRFISIDEPELGLHPAAISLLAALVKSISSHCQVLLATQSPKLLDEFTPEEVVVAERRDHATRLRRLNAEELRGWLEDYSLSALYDMNVLGGRP
jgi:predicted ATPase